MVFKLSFEDFITLAKRIDTLEGTVTEVPIFPIFYYVDNYVYLYKLYSGYVFCAVVNPENLAQFTERYLAKAYKLVENHIPNSYMPTSIPQENPNEP